MIRTWSRYLIATTIVLVILSDVLPRMAEAMADEYANHALVHIVPSRLEQQVCLGSFPVQPTDSLVLADKHLQDFMSSLKTYGQARHEALILLVKGDLVSAKTMLTVANDPVSRLWLARLEASLGNYEEAAHLLLQDYPDALDVLLERGKVVADRGSYADALRCFEVAVRLDATGASALILRGRMYQLLGQNAKALADFDQALMRCPACWQPYSYRAEINAAAGKETSGQDIQAALRLSPGNVYVEAQWGFWLRDTGQDAQAIQQLQRVVQIWPELLDAHLTLATLYDKHGQVDQALKVLDRAATLFPAGSEAAVRIADQKQLIQTQR